MKSSQKISKWKQIVVLQAVVFVYSIISMLSKYVSGFIKSYGLFSWHVVLGVGGVFLALAVYAFFWQKILKKVDLSIAYSNKAVGLLWTLVWAAALFGEKVTLVNVVGLVMICIGVIVVTT